MVKLEGVYVPAEELYEWNGWPMITFPVVDGDFLPAHPALLMRSGNYSHVDVITGGVRHEGSVFSLSILLNKNVKNQLEENFTTAGPISLSFGEWESNRVYLTKRVYYHYLGEPKITKDNAQEFTQMLTDISFGAAQEIMSELHTAHGAAHGINVFKYLLQHRGQHGSSDLYARKYNATLHKGWVGHGDDLQYLFNAEPGGKSSLQRPDDLFMSHTFVTLWTNFATTG
nr:juvenile hormone esterase-like [Procambarus clarkii]